MLSCRYQEGGKRGLPVLYMTSLENRLHDTEAALYSTLSALRGHGIDDFKGPVSAGNMYPAERPQRSKAEKQAEWKQQPLRTKEDLLAWFQERQAGAHNDQDIALPAMNPDLQIAETELPTLNMDDGNEQRAYMQTLTTDMSPVDVIERLKQCRRPVVPNNSASDGNDTAWLDCYF
jgi:hypothetical protein